ncbi:MAG: hypothetical protein FWC50_05030 [Planctomycetaceae bacterium]|nr:hypothetical protein [Planctomycetaceae bacterium]
MVRPRNEDCSIKRYRLPESPNDSSNSPYRHYDISIDGLEGFEPCTVSNDTNVHLSIWYLLLSLTRRATQIGLEVNSREGGIDKSIEIVTNKSSIGKEVISIKPYYLSNYRRLGFLMIFRFRKGDAQHFGVEILKKSLALNASGRSNANYYLDHFNKIQSFRSSENFIRLFSLPVESIDGLACTTTLEKQQQVESQLLLPKTYVFRDEAKKKSQFYGVKEFGPYESLPSIGRLVFLFREQDRTFSQDVYRALAGQSYPHTFSGMDQMFGFPMNRDTVSGFPIENFKPETIQRAIENHCQCFDTHPIVPVVIVPWSKTDPRENEVCDDHFRIKHLFLQSRMPSQFISTKQLLQKDNLKWSTSNIGLGIFAKMGGKPWKLVPQTKKCLIIGIGQAQFRQNTTNGIKRYYAYSVLTDSSGLYETIRVLSDSDNESTYLDSLTNEIRNVIMQHQASYDHFVIHSPFKIRREHMERIKKTLEEISLEQGNSKSFCVMKFNEQDQYIGFSSDNSKVPLEGTHLSLGRGQHLIWFEGAQTNQNIRRAISRPTHVAFEYPSPSEELNGTRQLSENRQNYIQDAINLSGANWRGFNAKNTPVSVYYAKIIADYIENFDRLNLPTVDINGMPPWFL